MTSLPHTHKHSHTHTHTKTAHSHTDMYSHTCKYTRMCTNTHTHTHTHTHKHPHGVHGSASHVQLSAHLACQLQGAIPQSHRFQTCLTPTPVVNATVCSGVCACTVCCLKINTVQYPRGSRGKAVIFSVFKHVVLYTFSWPCSCTVEHYIFTGTHTHTHRHTHTHTHTHTH